MGLRGVSEIPFKKSIPRRTAASFGLYAIGSAANGNLYLGYEGGLLVSTPHPAKRNRIFIRFPDAAAPVHGILAEDDGKVWFGCGEKLCLLDSGRVTVFDAAHGLEPDQWSVLLRDSQGNLWVRGLQRLSMRPVDRIDS